MTTLQRITRPRPVRRAHGAGALGAILISIALALLLGACSGSGDSDTASQGEFMDAGPKESGDEADSDGAQDAAGAGSEAEGTSARAPALDRQVISTGTVSLRSDDVATARREVQRIVDARGGTVTEENTETDDDGVALYARLVLRVPTPEFDEAMTALEDAAELRNAQRSSEDVTTEVIDTNARVRAQDASLRRVERLLAEADTIKDIIWIESQLTTRQAELDSLKSQQAYLADQTSQSTITVDIERTPEEKKAEEDGGQGGFLSGLRGGLTALETLALALATVLGALLPFLAVAAVLGVPTWLLVRRTRRGRRETAATDGA